MRILRDRRRRALACSASTFLLSAAATAVPLGAWAQSADQGPTIGELVVTAQKRSENLQDVPVAVTAYTAEMRDSTGIVTAQMSGLIGAETDFAAAT